MSSVALGMIVKDEVDQVAQLVGQASHYFDEIHLTVSDKTAANKLRNLPLDNLHVTWREWTDDFAAARNANLKEITTDLMFWVDADDEFDFSTIPKLVKVADRDNLDAVYLPYNYAQDEEGRCIALHWRERLVRLSHGFEWKGVVHENLLSETPFKSARVDQPVIHRADHIQESAERNHKILEKVVQVDPDPRYLHYLGLSYFTKGDDQSCIDVMKKFIPLSGWDEEIYRSYCTMAEAAYRKDDIGEATEYAMRAMAMFPHYPQSYWLMAQFEADQNNWKESLEWVRVAEMKKLPDTMSIVDPTNVHRCRLLGAQAEYMLGNFNSALAWLRKSEDPAAKALLDDFTELADEETFLTLLPKIRKYFASDKKLYDALSYDIQYDNRARPLREISNPPKNWGDKSIVILCGKGYEEWGPHTLDKGMGGSEEAIIYLSRELAKLGWEVTIYGEVDKPIIDEGNVIYLPWKEFDRRDHFNVFVGWRTPVFTDEIDAKVVLADIHDIMPEDAIKPNPRVTYMVKSQYHRNLYPGVPDENFRVIGNGISKEQFNG